MKYLLDASALVRIWRRQVDTSWRAVAGSGQMMISEPALAETLVSAGTKEYAAIEDQMRETYPYAVIPDNVWDLVAMIRRELVPHSAHQGQAPAGVSVVSSAY